MTILALVVLGLLPSLFVLAAGTAIAVIRVAQLRHELRSSELHVRPARDPVSESVNRSRP